MQATIAIFLGDLSGGVTVARVILLVIYAAILTWLARYLIKHLRAKHHVR